MPITSKRLAGPGYIILNVIRAMNIVALLAVIVASVVMVVKTFTASKVCRIPHSARRAYLTVSSSSSSMALHISSQL